MELKELLIEGIKTNEFPKLLYKYREFGSRSDDIIINSEFYFALAKSFNDPFDCNLSYREDYSFSEIEECKKRFLKRNPNISVEIKEYLFKTKSDEYISFMRSSKQELMNNTGILSLSKTNNSVTMWSHYSKKHEGLVFELDVEKDYTFFKMFGMVEYEKEYELLSYLDADKEETTKQVLTKFVDWEYEQEIRIIDFDKYGHRKFNKNLLKTVYFGFKSSTENMKHIIQLCQLNGFSHVKFKKAKLIPGKFALEFDEVNKNDYV
ncbi:MAG: DUF2971 domain-containing protein [Arcobacteraceae bacterium]